MSNELKPCPFCGSAPIAELLEDGSDTITVTCSVDGCVLGNLAVSVAAWNRRVTDETESLRAQLAAVHLEYWDALCGNDAIAPTPATIKDYRLCVVEPMAIEEATADLRAQLAEAKEKLAAYEEMMNLASEVEFDSPESYELGYMVCDPEFGWKPHAPSNIEPGGHVWTGEIYESPLAAFEALKKGKEDVRDE